MASPAAAALEAAQRDMEERLRATEARAAEAEARAAAAEASFAEAKSLAAAAAQAHALAEAEKVELAERSVVEAQRAASEAQALTEKHAAELEEAEARRAQASSRAATRDQERQRLAEEREAQRQQQRALEEQQRALEKKLRVSVEELDKLKGQQKEARKKQKLREQSQQQQLQQLQLQLKAKEEQASENSRRSVRSSPGGGGAKPSSRRVGSPAESRASPGRAKVEGLKVAPTDWATKRKQQMERAAKLRAEKAGMLLPGEAEKPAGQKGIGPSPIKGSAASAAEASLSTASDVARGVSVPAPQANAGMRAEAKAPVEEAAAAESAVAAAAEPEERDSFARLEEEVAEAEVAAADPLPPVGASLVGALPLVGAGNAPAVRDTPSSWRDAAAEAVTAALGVTAGVTAPPAVAPLKVPRLDFRKLFHEEIDDSLPLARPHTPTAQVVASLANGAAADGWASDDYETDGEADDATDSGGSEFDRHVGSVSTESEQESEGEELSQHWNKSQRYGAAAGRTPVATPLQSAAAVGAWKYAQQLSRRTQQTPAPTEADEIMELKQLLSRGSEPRRPQAFMSAIAVA